MYTSYMVLTNTPKLLKGSVHKMGPNFGPSRIWTFFIPLESVPKIKKKY